MSGLHAVLWISFPPRNPRNSATKLENYSFTSDNFDDSFLMNF